MAEGKNKKRYEKYKNSGHREINKKLKQERHQKRLERFRKRAENKDKAKDKSNDRPKVVRSEEDRGTNLIPKETIRARKPGQLPLSYWRSVMQIIANQIDKDKKVQRRHNHRETEEDE